MTLSDFEKYISGPLLHKGMGYWKGGKVSFDGSDGGTYFFTVSGTDKYCVTIDMSANGKIQSYCCDCPYDWSMCKHIVACLYYMREHFSTEAEQKVTVEDNFDEGLEGMKPLHQAYLCYLACTGICADGRLSAMPKVEGLPYMTQKVQKALNKALRDAGWLVKSLYNQWSYWSHSDEYNIAPEHRMEALAFLLEKRTAWLPQFQRHIGDNYEAEALLQAAMCLSGNREIFDESRLTYPYISQYSFDFLETMRLAVLSENGGRLAPLLSAKLAQALLEPLVASYQSTGEVGTLERVRRLFDFVSCRSAALDRLHAILRRDWFYFKGELLPLEERDMAQAATLYVDAAILLYEGKTDEAIAAYSKGIRIGNKTQSLKGMPGDAITLLLYAAALGIRRSEADVLTLQTISGKRQKVRARVMDSVYAFVDFLKDSSQFVSRDIPYLVRLTEPLPSYIAKLFANFAALKLSEVTPPSIGCALLQSEMAAFCQGVDKGPWPYDSVLKRIRIRQKWELQIEDILAQLSKEAKAPAPSDERLYYLAENGYKRVEVKIQTRLKSGLWGKGKSLSMSRWYSADCPMDETDKAIHANWMSVDSHYEFPKLATLLPFCKGTDKIYTETRSGFFPVEVREEKPYIYTERKGDKITFHTNVHDTDDGQGFYEWSKDSRSIVFWPLQKSESALFNSVVKLGSAPVEAEPMLERLFESLKGKVEVQSDISGAVQLEKREGSSVLTVRLSPDMNGYIMRVLSHPLPDGELYLPAAKGEETVIDSIGQERFEVHRDLRAEKRNLKFVYEIVGDELPRDGVTDEVFLFPKSVLALLDAASGAPERFCIEWPKGGGMMLVEPKSSSWNISAVGKGGWFELEGELKVSEKQVITAAQLLELLRENGDSGQFIRIGEGEYLKLSEKLRAQLDRLAAVSQRNKGKTVIPELAMTVMEDSLGDILDVADEGKLHRRRKLIREASTMDFPVPDGLTATLRPYQEDGFRWMMSLSHWGAGACLADDMGLGKTVQSIAFMLAKAVDGPQMVVAPASVIGNWRNEMLRFCPSLRLAVFNDLPAAERAAALETLGPQSVLVTTYGLLVSECDALTSKSWATVILDEAHTIKNRDTKMSAAAMKLKATNRIALTGTPVQNHLGELWNLFHFINPGLLGSYEHFQEKFVPGGGIQAEASSKDALKRLVTPFMLRRTKNEVARELPDKTEIVVPVQLSKDELSVYEVLRREAKAELSTGGPLSVNVLAMMTKLRMASCAASLAQKSWKGNCTKLEVFLEKIEVIVDGGNAVLVFSQFTSFLQMARETLDNAGLKDYLYLDGSTPVTKRQKMVESFQKGEHRIFLISLKAGGLGLNLTGANYVIHLDPWWNPAIEQQATDRAYRIGQKQNVTVYHLISEGTIEEKILRLHSSKRQMAESILEGSAAAGRLTPEELLALLDDDLN